jgi:hypothetical protein
MSSPLRLDVLVIPYEPIVGPIGPPTPQPAPHRREYGDHFFGLNTILNAFPNARAVTAPAVIPEARRQLSPDVMRFWNAIFTVHIPEHPIVPDALDGDVIDLPRREH